MPDPTCTGSLTATVCLFFVVFLFCFVFFHVVACKDKKGSSAKPPSSHDDAFSALWLYRDLANRHMAGKKEKKKQPRVVFSKVLSIGLSASLEISGVFLLQRVMKVWGFCLLMEPICRFQKNSAGIQIIEE